jgi:hypothetical protein
MCRAGMGLSRTGATGKTLSLEIGEYTSVEGITIDGSS